MDDFASARIVYAVLGVVLAGMAPVFPVNVLRIRPRKAQQIPAAPAPSGPPPTRRVAYRPRPHFLEGVMDSFVLLAVGLIVGVALGGIITLGAVLAGARRTNPAAQIPPTRPAPRVRERLEVIVGLAIVIPVFGLVWAGFLTGH